MNYFIITDATANTGKPYITESGENTANELQAARFDSADDAIRHAESLNGTGVWYSIEEHSDDEFEAVDPELFS